MSKPTENTLARPIDANCTLTHNSKGIFGAHSGSLGGHTMLLHTCTGQIAWVIYASYA